MLEGINIPVCGVWLGFGEMALSSDELCQMQLGRPADVLRVIPRRETFDRARPEQEGVGGEPKIHCRITN